MASTGPKPTPNAQAMMMVLWCKYIRRLVPFSFLSLHDASRYLRARKFVPQDAFAQFKDTEKWRKDNNLDALYEKIEIKDYQEARSVVCRTEDKPLILLLISFLVPTMDWPSRSPRHSRLSLRGRKVGLEEDDCLFPSNLQVQGQRSLTIQDAPAFCSLRKFDPFRDAPVFSCSWETESRNTGRSIQQHRRYFSRRLEAVLEPQKSHAGCKSACHCPLP